ncbi:hypothetical protein J542_2362 [Acinetobacter baumannii 299505]|nr:hypothetical protein J542_2362 [Acinetobacter baumannii 299505]
MSFNSFLIEKLNFNDGKLIIKKDRSKAVFSSLEIDLIATPITRQLM